MGMNKLFYLLLLIFSYGISYSQINEIGFFAGGSNYIGDVGSTAYISPNKLAVGILYKWNRSPRHAYRFSYTQSTLFGNDLKSEEASRKQRGFSFNNSIKELSAGLEFNFFDFDLRNSRIKITPYVFSGLSYFFHDELYINTNGDTFKEKTGNSLSIPMIIGLKSNVSRRIIIGVEVGARLTSTDNLDGSNADNLNLGQFSFGNINNKDWYVFSGLTITYTFGRDECFCSY